MQHSTRYRLIFSFLAVSFVAGGVSLFIGGYLLYNAVLMEANNQVRLALNAADDVYETHVKFVKVALSITTLGAGFRSSLSEKRTEDLLDRLDRMAQHAQMDFAGIVAADGANICRIGPKVFQDEKGQHENIIARYVISHKHEIAGTVVLSKAFISRENMELADRTQFYPFKGANQLMPDDDQQLACMAIGAGIPIFENRVNGELIGVLYGGIVLNQSTNIVDQAQKSFFFDDVQQEKTTPMASILFDRIRIATNIVDEKGNRAIGTEVPDEVKEQVVIQGKQWTTTQLYLNDRYISAYEPIEDILGRRVGMLSIAVLESNYSNVQKKFFLFFMLATFLGAMIAIVMGYFISYQIMKPIHRLMKASQEVSTGNLSPDIGPISRDKEIAILQTTFKDMVESMKRRRMESRSQIIQSEKQASVGRLAAGVAHEINNPLTGVLTYTHMLLRRTDFPDDVRADLQVIAESTERVRKIVKGLLDFSRQTKLDPEPTEINRLVEASIKLIENQALLKGVTVQFHQGETLPLITLDRSQIQSVLLNILINALDASKPSDTITVHTTPALSASDTGNRGVEIIISDTGCGIAPDNLNKIFDPFFSTKEVGKGTGLGLSVSLGIVKEHGGAIRVQSEMGKGTTFFVWLPMNMNIGETKNETIGR
ncbi:MAG: cache domain-containing protein [Desulfobacterales bacterium]|jgi:two-component system NtrC family sensor kinase|nr:cache domain-containing protein [Desulfobacterales bacterium]